MPEVTIEIGGRKFQVACQEGEEHYLQAAAGLLDTEAQHLIKQIGRLPESRLLLMSALMLADKTAGLEDELKATQKTLAEREDMIAQLSSGPKAEPQRIEVPVVPAELRETMAELAARAEALADQVEDRVAG